MSGDSGPKGGLVRFVVGPDAVVVPDVAEKLPGRGMWVTSDRGALDKAPKLFSRAARQKVTAPPGLADLVEALLARRLTDAIALARKAGLAVCGYETVREALVAGKARLLLQASDGSQAQRAKLRPPGGTTAITVLSHSELGLAFARDSVIHAALMPGGITDRVRDDAARLSGLRGTYGSGTSPEGTED